MVRVRSFLMVLILMVSGLPAAEACYFDSDTVQIFENLKQTCATNYASSTWQIEPYPGTASGYFQCFDEVDQLVMMSWLQATCPTTPPPPPANVSSPTNVSTTNMCGSVARVDSQVLEESVDLIGTPFALHYSSARALGRTTPLRKRVSLIDNTFDSSLTLVLSDFEIAGRTFHHQYQPIAYLGFDFIWDGLDANGQRVKGSAELVSKFSEVSFPSRSNELETVHVERIGTFYAVTAGMGGWTITPNHFYDVGAKKLYRGDGAEVSVIAVAGAGGTHLVPSSDGTEVYVFDSTGRHLSTKTGVKGTVKYTFSYDGSGRLTTIVDQYSNTTTLTYTGNNLSSITSPYGQVTAIGVDANGYIASITNPASQTHNITYYSGGLLHTFQKARRCDEHDDV
ncbi:MAG: hypothetical protein IPJ84_14075 [Bdellovibrionales bacterium]|nr:hypothetical protein [Bdellovibrionales bacterium]